MIILKKMFYFTALYGNKVLKSDYLDDITAFFTTKLTNEDELFSKINPNRLIQPEQTHSDNIKIVDSKIEYKNTDGLILTNNQDAICLKFADCTPVILYDKKLKIASIVHAGWRGTASKVAIKAVEKMTKKFQSNTKDIIAVIGPAISICCYEVSDDVKTKLLSTVNNKENLYNGNYIDLKRINATQLKEAGIENIDICPYCTSCDNDLFYSYRKENGTQGRHKAFVKLS